MTSEQHFRIEVSNSQASSVLLLLGELDVASAPMLGEQLEALANDDQVVLDLRRLEFIDSTGLKVLVQAHRDAAQAGRRLEILIAPDGQVGRLFDLTGLRELLEVDDPDQLALGG